VRSWALDALPVASQSTPSPTAEAARAFLGAIVQAETSTHPGVGLGQDVRIAGYGLTGGALVHDERLLHLCVFDTQRGGVLNRAGAPRGRGGGGGG
jgi:hypothetical protein